MSGLVGPPRQQIIETEIGAEISLYDPSSERVLVLNTTASDVWRLADGTHTVEDIVGLLAQSYQVQAETIAGDVESAVDRLRDEGMLEGGDS